ncbi:hypothetical protein YC2023_035291 [Brassica napus]|uniref:F-box associated beta-propeller type 3 domain-containing protein n=1 Tax=Brassica oleracea TaxID=3712 RepID=A0A3P6ADK0_BRAOL|nr:unnamed protein product [Brassica oleracea]
MHLNITAPPRLLIVFADFYGEKILVASTPNPNAPSHSSSSNKDLIIVKTEGKKVYNACQGLICIGAGFKDVGICNPSKNRQCSKKKRKSKKRQVHTFPYFRFKYIPQNFPRPMYMLGYDPVEDQYKVLALDVWRSRLEHKVAVLGSGRNLERGSMCSISPRCLFDVRLETFTIIKVPSRLVPTGYHSMWLAEPRESSLTNKTVTSRVVILRPKHGKSFRLWVLEDAEKEVWSMNTFALPESAAGLDFKVMETFSTGEVCLVPKELSLLYFLLQFGGKWHEKCYN